MQNAADWRLEQTKRRAGEAYCAPEETRAERIARYVAEIAELMEAHENELSREEMTLLDDVCWELEDIA